MATPTARADQERQSDPAVQTPLDPAAVYRQVVEIVRRFSPAATNLRLVWDIPGVDQPGVLPLSPPAPDLSELAADILEVLTDAGGWLHGHEVGRRLDPREPVDHTAGHFKRALDELKAAGLMESSTRKGYRGKRL